MAQLRFLQSASDWTQFPPDHRPQVALAGRSNSGKSSFINLLGQGKRLAQVSSTPGKTRLLNYFDVNGKFNLVDMPGYGYAARAKTERAQWEKMVETYLSQCPDLKGLLLLKDIRRKWSEDEQMLVDFCQFRELHLAVGLTKADKLSRSQWMSEQRKLQKELNMPVFALSSLKKWGAEEIFTHIHKDWLT